MQEAQWFDIDLKTLRLQEIDLRRWPKGLTYRDRMQEECLETVVGFNLDLLFPGEDLLLVRAGGKAWRASDVLAVDPFGYLRVMELKKKPTSQEALEKQVISYGIHHVQRPLWQEQLAQALPDLPKQVDLRLEGFRTNQRTRTCGGTFVERHTPQAIDRAWGQYDRFQSAHLLANALRASRGAAPQAPAFQNPVVDEVVRRLYDLPLSTLLQEKPEQAAQRILAQKWSRAVPVAGNEFTLIAPGLSRHAEEIPMLEDRGAQFNLIDADLRFAASGGGVERAGLRWQPGYRTVPTWHV